MDDDLILKEIKTGVSRGLVELKPYLRLWAEKHLVNPRRIELSLEPDGRASRALWLVTDRKLPLFVNISKVEFSGQNKPAGHSYEEISVQ